VSMIVWIQAGGQTRDEKGFEYKLLNCSTDVTHSDSVLLLNLKIISVIIV